jgi:ribulose-phosphate 3-epimerase
MLLRPERSQLLASPPRLPLVAPSILSADFTKLGAECVAAMRSGADLLHVDVMDGHFAPNLSMGPAVCAAARRAVPDAFLDVHLMVEEPAAFLKPFADAGADHCTVHVEVVDDPRPLADACRSLGMTAGLAFNPATPIERVLPFVEAFDLFLCMSVVPGFSGQKFIADVLSKCARLKPLLRPEQRLEIDGGIAPATVRSAKDAGCDVLVAATAVFGAGRPDAAPDRMYATAIAALRDG